ncbi:MAG: hypothetical protein E7330_03950 [Clostridiales bacterium]|nr:hypothetical protein [Clostridiales bacterium]
MKAKIHYTIDGKRPLACAAALLLFTSAAVRIIWFTLTHGMGADAYTAIVHLAMPVLSGLLMGLFILKEKLKLTFIPLFFGVAFFILKAFSFPSRLHTVLCCILYTLVFILFTLTVSGRIPTRVPLILVFVLPFLYHIFVEDMALLTSAAPPTFLAWMPEISVLLIMAGLAAFAAGLRKKE